MKYSKWIGLFSVALMIFAALQPWVVIPYRNIVVTGLNATGTNFGKPALLNLILSGIAAIFFLAPYVMAKRANLFFCAFNLAWAIRNFIIVSLCRAGECPEKKMGLYLLLVAAIIMIICALFPDIELKKEKPE